MKSIDEVFQEEIKNVNVNEIFQEELRKQVAETVKRMLKDAIGPYSAFSKALEKAIEEQMKFNPDRLTLPEYSNFVVSQAEVVIKELMSEERGKIIQKSLRDKLAPNLVSEIEFEDLIEEIRDSLLESIKEEAESRTDLKYRIVCGGEKTSYTSSLTIAIYEGDKEENRSDAKAILYLMDSGKVYHSLGDKNFGFTTRFASYAFNNTLVRNHEDYDKVLSIEDLY